MAGKAIPISEALKAHRTYDLYHEYGLFNIEFAIPDLESGYKDQLLCSCVFPPSFRYSFVADTDASPVHSENVYDCNTLLIFMHDL